MKKYLIVSIILTALVFLLPGFLISPSAHEPDMPDNTLSDPSTNLSIAAPSVDHIPTGELDGAVEITVLMGSTVVTMDLGSYLVGVLRAEMPASFECDALKAQAVAARTYTLYKMLNGGAAAHPDADTCTDINCCKAYMDSETAADLWGADAEIFEAKLRSAVTETDGECILYDGLPILAVFHSSSAGMTMNSQDVWSSSLPYLTSVSSPETAETVPNFHTDVSFSIAELRALLRDALPAAALDGAPSTWFTGIQQLPNGTVTSLYVGGIPVSGTEFRSILSLRSACFTLSFVDDRIIFSVSGYGHGVGMSQYGANLLAKKGMTYREILTWYYTDTTVEVYSFPSRAS